MNIEQLKQVIAKIQLGDSRQVDRLVLSEWFDNIGHLDFTDSIAAVKMHRQESVEYLQPAHIVRNVIRIRNDRGARGEDELTAGSWEIRGDDKPANFDAMSAAWNNPAEFARQEAAYHRQLRARANGEVA